MNPEKHAYSRLHIWWLAIRPKTLPAALSAVIVACALTGHDGVFRLGPALATNYQIGRASCRERV